MNATFRNASEVLGPQLIKVFQETCRGDQRAFTEMVNEAMRALFQVRKEGGWRNYNYLDEQE